MPPPFSMWGGGGHIVLPLSVRTSVPSRPVRPSVPSVPPVCPVRNTFGFRAISFERIGVLD